jgi:lipopolysaccharide/colanic/teichoic acid biosynthesis glycosyltransferase
MARRNELALAMKRLIDLAGSTIAIVLFAPIFLIIAFAVKVQDGGPIIYRRRVVGRSGDFDAFKFRSMRPDADRMLERDGRLMAEFEKNYKLIKDPRVTQVGSFLRKASLDEMPQLFNVLRGEMSLVGPRMITRPELAKYHEFRDLLLTVKPGITGYWQVEGRQTKTYEERVHMDVFYINNWSLLLDLTILLKTPFAVVKGQGAY